MNRAENCANRPRDCGRVLMNFRLLNQDDTRWPRSQFQAEAYKGINTVAGKGNRHAVIVEDNMDDGFIGFRQDFEILCMRNQVGDNVPCLVASALNDSFRIEPMQRRSRVKNAGFQEANF